MGNESSSKHKKNSITKTKIDVEAMYEVLKLNTSYTNLSSLKQSLIKQITKNMAEILIENFRSLTLIFTTLEKQDEDSSFSDRSRVHEYEDSSEFDLWLGELNKRVFNFKKGLKKYRMTILNLLGVGKTTPVERMKALREKNVKENEDVFRDSILYLLAEGSGPSISACMKKIWDFEEFESMAKKENIWNFEKNLKEISKVLEFER